MSAFPLDRYLARIGLDAAPALDADGLTRVIQGQLRNIAFENFDVLLGRPVGLTPLALTAKLVDGKRGGYCFELNSLLALALSAMGFEVRPLLARVRFGRGPGEHTPRTHQLLLVQLDGKPWIADAGFGMGLPCAAMPLEAAEQEQLGSRLRLVPQGAAWRLQQRLGDLWADLYLFELGEVYPVDLVAANHFTATFPASPFRAMAMMARLTERGRLSVVRGQGTLFTAEGPRPLELPDTGRVAWLREHFGIELDVSDDALPPWVKATG